MKLCCLIITLIFDVIYEKIMHEKPSFVTLLAIHQSIIVLSSTSIVHIVMAASTSFDLFPSLPVTIIAILTDIHACIFSLKIGSKKFEFLCSEKHTQILMFSMQPDRKSVV